MEEKKNIESEDWLIEEYRKANPEEAEKKTDEEIREEINQSPKETMDKRLKIKSLLFVLIIVVIVLECLVFGVIFR